MFTVVSSRSPARVCLRLPIENAMQTEIFGMAKKQTLKRHGLAWTKKDVKAIKAHSKRRTPVDEISKDMKRTVGSLRQKALHLGIGLGHRR
jgi:hypothetical protein